MRQQCLSTLSTWLVARYQPGFGCCESLFAGVCRSSICRPVANSQRSEEVADGVLESISVVCVGVCRDVCGYQRGGRLQGEV
jgi:hypothetical protein